MTFELTTSGNFYSNENKSVLETLGFEFEYDGTFSDQPYSMTTCNTSIEINSLEELLDLSNSLSSDLIIGAESIEIYDDYRE